MAIDHDQKQGSGGRPAGGDDAGSRDPDQQRRLMIARQRQVMKARAAADADRANKVDQSQPVEDGPALDVDASRKNGAVKKSSKETTSTVDGDLVTSEQKSQSSTDRNTNKGGTSSKTTTVEGVEGSTSKSNGSGWKNTATEQSGEGHVETSVEDEHGKQTDHVGVTGKRDANGVQAGTEVSRTHQVGNATTSNKVGVSATDQNGHLAGDANVAHSKGNGREETTVGASGHLGDDGPSGQISAGQQEKNAKGQETGSSKVALGASKKGVSGTVETSDTTRDDEGNVRKDSSKLHGQVGKGGVVAGYDGTSTVTDKNGAGTSSSRGAEIDTKARTISGHLSETRTNARGEQTGSDSVGATVGKDQASVSASHSSGSTSVSAAGGFKVTTDPAVFDEATQEWLVSWRMELQGSASAKQGSKNSVSAGASAFTEREGVEVFDTREAAEAFSKNAATELMGGAGQVPQDAEGVLGMKVGEQRGTASGVDVSENASAQLDVVKLGAGAEEGMHHGLSVKRISKTEVEVTVDKSEFVKGAISGGAAGISVGKRAEKSKGSSIRVRFDLGTEEGKKAFDAYQENRRLLPGAVVVAEDVSESEGTGTDVSAAGQQVSMSSTTTEHHGKDEKGKYDDYKGKQSFHGKISVPGVVNYRADESNQIHEREQGGEKSYEVTTSIDDSGGQSSAEALGEATGGDSYNPQATTSGHWTLTSHFTADDIKEIAEKAQRGALVGGEQHLGGDLAELQKTLAAAGNDTQKQMKAISKYVADCGPEALADLRENVSRFQPDQYGKKHDQEFDLKLDGDRNFTGPAFWHDLDARIAGYQASLKQGDAASVLNGIDADRAELQRREGEISKHEKYTDLPEQLRQAQITRTQNYLSLLETIRSTAVSALQSKPEAAAQKSEGPQARVQSAMQSLAEGKADCARTFDKARTIRWYLRGAYASPDGFSSIASAHDWVHKNGDSHDHKVWGIAEQHFAGAMQHKALAESYESGMEALQREFLSAPNEAAADGYAAAIEKTAAQYSSASDGFASAHGIYANLLDRHPDWRHNLMLRYDESTIAPPGAGIDE